MARAHDGLEAAHDRKSLRHAVVGTLLLGASLISGAPVTDENVAAKIKEGGPMMPSSAHTLADSDIADLVAYLRTFCKKK